MPMEPHRHLGTDAPRVNFKYIEDTFDQTVPAALGTAATGTALTAPRRDHVHPLGGLSVGTISVSAGGTGVTTLAARGVVVGEGTSPVAVTGAGTAGQYLTSNGASADPTFQTFAVSGYEQITAQKAGPTTINTTVLVSAGCSSGKKILSGGGSIDSDSNLALHDSQPQSVSAWNVKYIAFGAAAANTITCFAVCGFI